jgi:hypothetical protein
LYIFYGITAIGIGLFFFGLYNKSDTMLYFTCALLGFGTGFWAIFVTMAAEQFGTNLRATAATTVPNMVRGLLIVITLLFQSFQTFTSYVNAGLLTGIVAMIVGVSSAVFSKETFGKDLNYVEQ